MRFGISQYCKTSENCAIRLQFFVIEFHYSKFQCVVTFLKVFFTKFKFYLKRDCNHILEELQYRLNHNLLKKQMNNRIAPLHFTTCPNLTLESDYWLFPSRQTLTLTRYSIPWAKAFLLLQRKSQQNGKTIYDHVPPIPIHSSSRSSVVGTGSATQTADRPREMMPIPDDDGWWRQ